MLIGPGTVPQCVECCSDPHQLLDTVARIVSIFTLPLAGLTFWLGYRQRERERTLSYYHKVVVDEVVGNVFEFFGEQIVAVKDLAVEAGSAIAGGRLTMPKAIKTAIAEFSTRLFDLQDNISERMVAFDEEAANSVNEAFQGIQDQVTAWFNDVYSHKRRNPEELQTILRTGQRTVLRHIYRGQFRNFRNS